MAYKPIQLGGTGGGGTGIKTPTTTNYFLQQNLANMPKPPAYNPTSYSSTNKLVNNLKTSAGVQTSTPKLMATTPPKPTTSKSSGSTTSSSYNYAPAVSSFQSSNYTGDGSAESVNDWISTLKKELEKGAKTPKLPSHIDLNKYAAPAPINLDKYRTEIATIEDIAKKYGFDYSREYAERQAEAIAQAQRDQVQNARERSEWETGRAQENLHHDFFNQYLQQQQQLVNSGLNAGIESERNLRLDMNRQHAMADILANAQLYNQELDRREGTITKEELAYAEQLYNERLQQGFGNAMEYTSQQRQENQAMLQAAQTQRGQIAQERQQMLQAALTQRDQKVQEAWREFEWNNMSASEKAKLVAEAERFGMEMAWERHKFDASMQFNAGYGSFNDAGGGGGISYPATSFQTSKGVAPASFQSHLSAAAKATGIPNTWIQPISQLIANESSWNPNAKNPKSTAHGYGQFLNSTRANYEKKTGIKYDTPVNQLILTIHYIKDRYGTPQKAMEFWNKNKWY